MATLRVTSIVGNDTVGHRVSGTVGDARVTLWVEDRVARRVKKSIVKGRIFEYTFSASEASSVSVA